MGLAAFFALVSTEANSDEGNQNMPSQRGPLWLVMCPTATEATKTHLWTWMITVSPIPPRLLNDVQVVGATKICVFQVDDRPPTA